MWSGSSLLQTARVKLADGSVDKLNLHQDRIGNVVLATRLSGSTIELWGRLQFDPYGRKVSNITWEGNGVHVPYRFAGQRLDPDTGLYLMGARWYSEELGRFIEQDPIAEGGGLNLYAYTGSSPTMWVDPSGLVSESAQSASSIVEPGDLGPCAGDSRKGGGGRDVVYVGDSGTLNDVATGRAGAAVKGLQGVSQLQQESHAYHASHAQEAIANALAAGQSTDEVSSEREP